MSVLAMVLTAAMVVPANGPEKVVRLFGSILFPVPSAHITLKNFERIKEGMKRQEIEAILDGPAGDYRTGPTCSCLRGFASFAVEDDSLAMLRWQGDEAEISVWVDSNGKAIYSVYECVKLKPVSSVERFLWRCERGLKVICWLCG